jgi:hypothetical protein
MKKSKKSVIFDFLESRRIANRELPIIDRLAIGDPQS